jgi:hypothetical protein
MPIIAKSRTFTASENVANLLAGEFFEFLPYNAMIEIGLSVSAAQVLVDIITGTDVIAKEVRPVVKSTAPLYPDDFVYQDIAAAGERIVIAARETAAATPSILYTVRITPV